jgi:SAM-dependent methyltransferase
MKKFVDIVKSWIAHPLTKDVDINNPEMTMLRHQIIQEKIFLQKIYSGWYNLLVHSVYKGENGSILELGSGGGFLKNFLPNLITSDVLFLTIIDVVLSGHQLPFKNKSLSGIVMTNVFHHIPEPPLFLKEAARCIKPGGVVAMIEPWVSPWSRWFFTRFHHEPFEPSAKNWSFTAQGPLSSANGALPWIIFKRDYEKFKGEFPEWEIDQIELFPSLRYIASGGVSLKFSSPIWTYKAWEFLDWLFYPLRDYFSMFALIILKKHHLLGT